MKVFLTMNVNRFFDVAKFNGVQITQYNKGDM